ncbi:SseB family protein [Methanobrevibacter thaueri]|uniref:SseB family protein n=1 Tax=Methanobrevibacter thaueri TaxID=190975 RepID=UPI001402CAA7|nr:SseB family protein [Methanobrevibacter thaueri]
MRVVIEDIYANGNRLNENLALKLVNEFRYSNLYIAAKKENDTLNFITYEYNDMKLTALFTDHDEFRKFHHEDDIQLLQNSFELYQNILKTTDFDGYILNPASEKYLFTKEFILTITNIPKTNFYTTDAYSAGELLDIYRNVDNRYLEEYISNPKNVGDYEMLFERLANSTILTLMVSDMEFDNDIIDLREIGPVAGMYTDKVGGIYVTIFSSTDRIRHVNTSKFKYAQLVNLAMLVNYVLVEDLDGIVLNPDSDNVLIPRSVLLRYSLGFERYANDARLCEALYYMFALD